MANALYSITALTHLIASQLATTYSPSSSNAGGWPQLLVEVTMSESPRCAFQYIVPIIVFEYYFYLIHK